MTDLLFQTKNLIPSLFHSSEPCLLKGPLAAADTNFSILCLPEEVLFKIFSYLDISTLITRVRMVCSSWKKIIDGNSFWCFLEESKGNVIHSQLLKFLQQCVNLEHFRIDDKASNLKWKFLEGISDPEKLKSLAVIGFITNLCCAYLLEDFIKKLPCINNLSSESSDILKNKVIQAITEIKELKTLVLSGETTLHRAALDKLSGLNSNILEYLDLSYQYNLAGTALCTLLQIKTDSLKSLVLEDLELTDSTLQEFENCPKLAVLKIYCKKLTDATLQKIQNLCLNELELLVGVKFTSDGLRKLLEERFVSQLKQLNLSYCLMLEDSCLSTLANNCPELVNLTVSECRRLTDKAISQVIDKCSKLPVLNLSGLTKLDGTFLTNISAPIKVLDLTFCSDTENRSIGGLTKVHNGFSLKTESHSIISRIFEPMLVFTPSSNN